MGNNSAKETVNNGGEDNQNQYYQMLTESNISGTTWKELGSNLKKHIESGALEKEWKKLCQKDAERNEADDLFATARISHNAEKNRYFNILPFDSTRVKLTEKEGVQGSDYINANFVNIENRNYICCQAPMENTLADFHRMLWETNVYVIVMLTRFIELGTIKATEYFPPHGSSSIKYGDFDVDLVSEEKVNTTYVVRKIILTHGDEKRTIHQYHFLAWPDHGTPDEPLPLSEMITRVNKHIDSDEKISKSPVVVHCSAGIGRTGTYVIVNTILEQLTQCMKENPTTPPSINMMKMLHQLRGMRSGMVTHKDQYEFCYKTVLAHIQKLNGEEVTNESKKQSEENK